MSIKLVITKLMPEDESLDELTNRTEARMNIYSQKHPDFSVVLEKHIEENFLLVKSLMLQEYAN